MMRFSAVLAAIGLGAAAMWWSAAAQALGLGEVEVRSHLNERFAASIPLVAASDADLDSLVIEVASPEAFARSGVERPDVVSGLSFTRAGNGIRVSSREPIRDPFLTFIVEARWNGGRLLREYTVLLDPPGSAPQAPAPVPAPAPAAPPILIATPTPTPLPLPGATAPISEGRYGPVQPGQTLWSIAKAVPRAAGVTQEQMLLALYNGNPQAFAGGDIDHLLKGSVLKLPTTDEAKAIDASAARAQVMQLREVGLSAQTAAAEAASTAALAPAPAVSAAEPAVSEPPPAPVPEAIDPSAPETAATETPSEIVAGGETDAVGTEPAAVPALEPFPPLEPAAAPPVDAETAVDPEAPVESEEPAPAPPPAAEDGAPWLLIGILALVLLALVALRMKGRRRDVPAPRRTVSSLAAVEALPPGADALMDRPRTRPLPDEAAEPADAAPAAAEPLASAADAADDDGSADPAVAGLGLGGVDAADPMTEADFHLAYGLYDEAAQMLKSAIAADPERSELKVKLAEVYSAAGNADEFRALAEGMSGQVAAADWQKVSAMGRSILPDLSLFRDAEARLAMTPPSAPLADALRDLSVVDFDLDADARRIETPAASEPVAPPPATIDPLREALLAPLEEPPAPEPSGMVSFDAPDAAPAAAPVAAAPAQKVDLLADLDLSSFDLDDDKVGVPADSGRVEFTMADLEAAAGESIAVEPESEVIGGDEIDTKLDLARAYADMGDADAARTLLDEVAAGGTERQRQDAEALRERLSG